MNKRIYLDVDDTLNDFRGECARRGIPDSGHGFYTNDPSTWTPAQVEIDRAVRELMDRRDFWENIPIAPRAFEIIAAASTRGEPYLLTATPRGVTDEVRQMITDVKFAWAHDVLHFPRERVIVCERHQKVEYALGKYPNVLVDDAIKNCTEWANNGGVSILHNDPGRTISVLKTLEATGYHGKA